MITFRLESRSGEARAGVLDTSHGPVPTPAFMPVATQATVKALPPDRVATTGARMIIANTYHLWIRPGPDVVSMHGGLHGFARWPHAIATDSGGFQALSLAERTRQSEDGFEFASHLDGARMMLTPEESMRVQGQLGADVAMQLDVCPPGGVPDDVLAAAVDRTTRWAKRCLAARRDGQGLFGIVQGGTDVRLRLRHHDELAALPLDGIALGGFSVGEPVESMHQTLVEVVPRMDPDRPRYLMGVGTPSDLVRAIGIGVDLFDCVLPTRNARNGQAFTTSGKLVLKNARYARDTTPLDPQCDCSACAGGFSRAYLRHLLSAREILGHQLVTEHNLRHYGRLVAEARAAIQDGRYSDWADARLRSLAAGEGQGQSDPS